MIKSLPFKIPGALWYKKIPPLKYRGQIPIEILHFKLPGGDRETEFLKKMHFLMVRFESFTSIFSGGE